MRTTRILAIALLAVAAMSMGLRAQDGAAGDEFTAVVTKGDLSIEVELAGRFVAENKDEIRLEPKAYKGDLIVTFLKPEGAAVKQGDALMRFDPSSLERSLEDARNEVSDKKVALDKADAERKAFEIEQATTLARSEKELAMAQRELEKTREQQQLELEQKEKQVEDAAHNLADARVDFDQLTQLYHERELHTATENILIERETRRIQDLERGLERTKREADIWKRYDQYKPIEEKELDVAKKQAELDKARIKLEADHGEKAAEVQKAQRTLSRAEKEVGNLEADAAALEVVAPRDGIVFYGTIGGDSMSDIVFIGMDDQSKEMRIGGRVRTHQILMTVASMERLSVSTRVLENDIQHMKPGLPISIRPDAFPALSIDGKLTKVDQVAQRTGFLSEVREFKVTGEYEGVYRQLRSGMNCRVTVHADKVPDALQVPVLAVFSEGGEFYCLAKEGETTARRPVKLGATNGTMVEITEGLREGEKIALWDPSGD
jgi:multidrug efflux pump subunit AcrA (membrane-fusion protein)